MVGSGQGALGLGVSQQGMVNRLVLSQDELFNNLKQVQLKSGPQLSVDRDSNDLHCTVEMETGTGKTYVYLRSIYELYQASGMAKFVIVVLCLAMKVHRSHP